MAVFIPTATLNDILNDRYNGVTITGHLTNGIVYSTSTSYANVTGAAELTTTASGIAASSGSMGPVTFAFSNSSGDSITYDGIAFTIGGTTVELGTNDISGTLGDGNSISYLLTIPASVA
jgi:hypothetical protein